MSTAQGPLPSIFLKISHLLMVIAFLASPAVIAQNTAPSQPGQSQGPGQQSQARAIPLGQKPPANFPVPIYSSNVVTMNFMRAASSAQKVSGTIVTRDPAGTAFKWYQNALAAGRWTMDQPQTDPTGNMLTVSGKNGTTQVTIRCMTMGKSPQTIINVTCVPIPRLGRHSRPEVLSR